MSSSFNEIAGKVARLLDTITAEQLQNLRMIPSDDIYIQVPLESETGADNVEIHISSQGRKGSRKIDARNVLLTLAVSMSNLGRVKAALSIVDGSVSCRLKAERKQVVELLTANIDILKKGLEELDYQVANIECAMSRSDNELSIIGELSRASSRELDVRA